MGSLTRAEPKNLLIFSIGPQSRKSHIPNLIQEIAAGGIGQIVGISIHGSEQDVSRFVKSLGAAAFPMFYIPKLDGTANAIPEYAKP